MVRHLARAPVPPPYMHRGVSIHSFSVPVPGGALQALCDAWFKESTGGEVCYRPLLDRVFVLSANIDEIQPADPAYADMGIASEQDVGLWALVVRTTPFAPVPRWLPIRLFVDSADAVVVGREVYGFQKEQGRLVVPPGAPSAGPFVVEANVTQAPGDHLAWKQILRIDPVGAPGPAQAGWQSIGEVAQAFYEFLVSEALDAKDPFVLDLVAAGLSLDLPPFAFLKQMMAVDGTDRACYQAVLESDSRLVTFRGGGFTAQRYTLQLTSTYSHPFEQYLGIDGKPIDVGRAVWAQFDFSVNAGSVLHERP
jgi:hypothetical protein